MSQQQASLVRAIRLKDRYLENLKTMERDEAYQKACDASHVSLEEGDELLNALIDDFEASRNKAAI
jgi:hypothetical protein